ncbi:MAG: type IV toxin-antitoxin system AbiEi family antitoxin domain-containing protein [Actinobacteria bacterium]|nr:type IV toxin-antitoxin system AbiEi family antitoxin domain-containing protein [Actinomycetota bacterium]
MLASLGRMARTAELRRLGVGERELTRAVRTGEVVRVRQGVYALPDEPPEQVHAAMHGGAVGCAHAATRHGLWILRLPDELHIWLGQNGTPRGRADSCQIHWDGGHVEVGALPPVRNVLLQLGICTDEETFFAALESALRQSLVHAVDLRWLRPRLPRPRRRLVDLARSDADSGLESLIRLRLHRLGIAVRTQVQIEGVGEVDLLIGGRLIVEADGEENHAGADKRHKDLRRDAAATALGYVTLRFDYDLIVHHWDVVERAILAALARA